MLFRIFKNIFIFGHNYSKLTLLHWPFIFKARLVLAEVGVTEALGNSSWAPLGCGRQE